MFTYFTLGLYLVAGVIGVRVFAPEMTEISLDTSYAEIFSKYEVKNAEEFQIPAPEIAFTKIVHPAAPAKVIPVKKVAAKKPVTINKIAELKTEQVQPNELPFFEPVQLHPIRIEVDLDTVASLYNDFKYEETVVAEAQTDEVSTKLAADAEPEFFEYEEKIEAPKEEVVQDIKEEIKEEIAEVAPEAPAAESAPVQTLNHAEEVELDELISFDYSKAQTDLKSQSLPTVSTMTTQAPVAEQAKGVTLKWDTSKPKKTKPAVTTQNQAKQDDQQGFMPDQSSKSAYRAPVKTYDSFVTIKASGSNLKTTQEVVGFEIRFQDAMNDSYQDYNNGDVTVREVLSSPKMTRSMVMLKRGFAPTNSDLILEEGSAEITIPLIAEDTFNELMAPYGARGSIGSVLVELDQKTDTATLDVPYSQVLKLDENMKVTTSGDFTYQMFVGVKAGNALLTYKTGSGQSYSKIIHIHEHELTFDSDISEDVEDNKFSLVENDLLGKESMPLILSSEEVRQFATDKTAMKVNDHTYKVEFEKVLLGSRKYLELSHQSEPVFVGFKEKSKLEIPSESFMRYVLSRFEGSKLGNRCLVQVNLSKKASGVEIGSESTASSLMTSYQALDTDGKFYDSVGEKTRKIVVVGESQGAPELSQDGKINLKITYQDGSVQYLGSYCSPNTYLVEQL